jgi:hypothetical protein
MTILPTHSFQLTEYSKSSRFVFNRLILIPGYSSGFTLDIGGNCTLPVECSLGNGRLWSMWGLKNRCLKVLFLGRSAWRFKQGPGGRKWNLFAVWPSSNKDGSSGMVVHTLVVTGNVDKELPCILHGITMYFTGNYHVFFTEITLYIVQEMGEKLDRENWQIVN